MKENFLHFLWRYRRFDHSQLFTTEGESIQILHPGLHNHHSGADFSNARLCIGGTEWAGNVEMHVKSSEWFVHEHQHDRAYDNVILHVVLEEDKPVYRADGSRIPCLEMRKRIPPGIAAQFEKLLHQASWIPCERQVGSLPESKVNLWIDRLLVERLERKTLEIRQVLDRNRGDWEETFYQFTARNFGLKVNAEPFGAMAKSLPQQLLATHRDQLFQLEALLFGQAGMLEGPFTDKYPNELKREYRHFQRRYKLLPINAVAWKFFRLHPGNFPTVRLAQFAQLIHRSVHLFSKMLEVEDMKEVERLFAVSLDGYWLTHYTFDKKSDQKKKSFGKEAIHLLTINTIVPFLFLYGAENQRATFRDKAFRLLEQLPAERNAIIKKWVSLGIRPDSAYQSQALLQLKKEYCANKRCLECGIGVELLNGQ